MTSPARIAPTITIIELLWRRYPELRLGQLLLNIEHDNLWNLEDEDLQWRVANILADGWVDKREALTQTEEASS